jgi:hypothetical protein
VAHRKCLEAASDTDGVPVAGQRHGKGVQRGSRRSSSPEREVQAIAIANKSRQQSSRRHADAGVTKKSAGYLQQ